MKTAAVTTTDWVGSVETLIQDTLFTTASQLRAGACASTRVEKKIPVRTSNCVALWWSFCDAAIRPRGMRALLLFCWRACTSTRLVMLCPDRGIPCWVLVVKTTRRFSSELSSCRRLQSSVCSLENANGSNADRLLVCAYTAALCMLEAVYTARITVGFLEAIWTKFLLIVNVKN